MMVSRRKILSRSRDQLNVEGGQYQQQVCNCYAPIRSRDLLLEGLPRDERDNWLFIAQVPNVLQ